MNTNLQEQNTAVSNDTEQSNQGQNKYVCFYKGKQFFVYSDTQIKARGLGVVHFRAKKATDVDVMLVELNGKQYVHTITN